MRRATLHVVACAAAALIVPPRAAAGQAALSAADSADIVRAAWTLVTGGYGAHRVLWLYAPATADTARVVPFSAAVRAALVGLGVPAAARRPSGDDTVVVRVIAWRDDAGGISLQVASSWTVVLGAGTRRCRTGSGNHERIRVSRSAGAWTAVRDGPILHGDRVCVPIP